MMGQLAAKTAERMSADRKRSRGLPGTVRCGLSLSGAVLLGLPYDMLSCAMSLCLCLSLNDHKRSILPLLLHVASMLL